jgi:threonine/homoserine/homoserine lactone efflux protein
MPNHLLEFVLISWLLILAPGPNVLFTISQSLRQGRKSGLAAVVGCQAGCFVQVLAVAFGIGAIVEESATVFSVIKLAGAAYIIYLGVQAIRRRRSLAAVLDKPAERKSALRMLADGFVVGVTNPKVIIYFAAVLPQFADRSAGSVPLQIVLLGAIFVAIGLMSDSIWAIAAGYARGWFTRSPRRLSAIGGTGGLVMIGIGASLAVTGRQN